MEITEAMLEAIKGSLIEEILQVIQDDQFTEKERKPEKGAKKWLAK